MPLKIYVAQINSVVGDLDGNAQKIIRACDVAKERGADLVVTPELALTGYPPEDLFLRPDFIRHTEETLSSVVANIGGVSLIVGHPYKKGEQLFNAASVVSGGLIQSTYLKRELPNYRVFDEARYFEPGAEPCVVEINSTRVGINICEDIWGPDGRETQGVSDRELEKAPAVTAAKSAGAELLVVLNASPYHIGKQGLRKEVVKTQATLHELPVIFCNLIGGQDELVFDGGSFACHADGSLVGPLPFFQECGGLFSFENGKVSSDHSAPDLDVEESVYQALVLGVRDYVEKNGFKGVLIGLSGGIDSALTLAVAADALGADRVHAVMMPSQFTANISLEDAAEMAKTLGVEYSEIAIKPIFDEFMAGLSPQFAGRPFDTTEENLQSRIRGTLLMSLSNKFGSMVLTTGNKSEMSTGYATLYGDMAGGFAVLKDLTKQMVYRLSVHRNRRSACIPPRIIERPPSAELRPDQLDADSLPDYAVLDAIVEHYVEFDRGVEEIIQMGFDKEDVERIVRLIHINEYKRRQSPPGVRVTARGYGKDWRYPITSKFRGLINTSSQ